MSNVIQVDGQWVSVTPENYTDVTNQVWSSKNVTDNATKLSIAEALRNLAFGSVLSTRDPVADSVINQPTVRLSDRIAGFFGTGNPVAGGSFFSDLRNAGEELAKNFSDKYVNPPDGSTPGWKIALIVGGVVLVGVIAYKIAK